MKSFEYAQMHLQNVQQQIQQLEEQKLQIEQNIVKAQEFLDGAVATIREEMAAYDEQQSSAAAPAVDPVTTPQVPNLQSVTS